ncbi:MAG: hypothetical protein QF921_08540 [Pseudomonadales bacterium]|jgi:hypothetical protein|nr:hypothetical protein [Pseudomonadales bacterium]MDP6470198.1 hypothetical protein [Pseudomonadales bacterium]MDP6827104.1 hypothetical protein [Pseudomonadales bacterium]MDP6971542.1 hypothetical protein [Pseudomonadales bacterium]|tara:strand:+ start:1899 stop:2366 length:468 start_codon:yes stop_codon:yes gene_type:complete
MRLGRISLTFGDSPTHIAAIHIVARQIRAEEVGGKTNIDVLTEQLERHTSSTTGRETAGENEPLKLTIDRVEVTRTEAVLVSGLQGDTTQLAINRITLTGLAGTQQQIADQFLERRLASLQKAAADAIADRANDVLQEKANEKLGDLNSKLLGKL